MFESKDFTRNNPSGVVAIDGIEYLITHNNFQAVIKFLHGLNDFISVGQFCLLISVNPDAFEPQEMKLIERDLIKLT